MLFDLILFHRSMLIILVVSLDFNLQFSFVITQQWLKFNCFVALLVAFIWFCGCDTHTHKRTIARSAWAQFFSRYKTFHNSVENSINSIINYCLCYDINNRNWGSAPIGAEMALKSRDGSGYEYQQKKYLV